MYSIMDFRMWSFI